MILIFPEWGTSRQLHVFAVAQPDGSMPAPVYLVMKTILYNYTNIPDCLSGLDDIWSLSAVKALLEIGLHVSSNSQNAVQWSL